MTVGWCPGALRPMESGDGYILRVKPRGGRLTLDQAEAVACLSQRFGNGHLDLTGRANLQIRGARPDTLEALTNGLREAGLLDPDVAVEALRNIVASPLAGLDPDCFDTRPFLARLEHCLIAGASASATTLLSSRGGAAVAAIPAAAGDLDGFTPIAPTGERSTSLCALPAKWNFVVDGGGRLPLTGVSADMRFRFDRSGTLRLGLDTSWSEPLSGSFDLARMLAASARLVAAQPRPMRMRALLDELGPDAVFAHLNLRVATQPLLVPATPTPNLFADRDGVVAFAPPFGSLEATLLGQVAAIFRSAGGTDVRLTPWRVLFATGIADRASLTTRLSRFGLICDAGDPRLSVSACVGAPACHRATTSTRADAAVLASRLGHDIDGLVHVAGCAKGCARPPKAAWTLIAREGRYDLVHAGDATPRAGGLSSTQAANWLSRAGRARTL